MMITVLVPIKTSDLYRLTGMEECYRDLVFNRKPGIELEIIIADDSDEAIFRILEGWFVDTPILHLKPPYECKTGKNNKLNSVDFALQFASGEFIILIDDDCRPTTQTLIDMAYHLNSYDCVKFMVDYNNPTIIDLINTCGIFIINIVSTHKQFWGNIAFRRTSLYNFGFPNKDVLFDELALEERFRTAGARVGYVSTVAIPMLSNTTWREFVGQRVRYAYENIAYKLRFTTFLSIVPVMAICGVTGSIAMPLYFATALTLAILVITIIGQLRYSRGRYPWFTFLLSPFWFWWYPFTSWLALVIYWSGGVSFGGNKIKRPV